MIRSLFFSRYFSSFNTNKDYYKVLNLSTSATGQQIKKAFRNLAKQYHPDTNKGNQEKFKQINEAYQILSSESTKRDYDDARKANSSSYTSGFRSQQQSGQNRYHDYQSTYRGYNRQTGWQNRNFREQTIRNIFRQQQEQLMRQNKGRGFSHRQQSNKQNQYQQSRRNIQEQLQKILRQRSEQIKITRESVRKAYEQEEKRRQREFRQYSQKRKQDLVKQMKDKAWKMAQGAKDNIEGLVKVGKYVKENLQTVGKIGKYASSLWEQFKNSKKK